MKGTKLPSTTTTFGQCGWPHGPAMPGSTSITMMFASSIYCQMHRNRRLRLILLYCIIIAVLYMKRLQYQNDVCKQYLLSMLGSMHFLICS